MSVNSKFQSPIWDATRITSNVDFTSPGKRSGDLRLKHSDNETALGYIPIPVGVIAGSPGPTVLLTGGVHGDEFEGPLALVKLYRELPEDLLNGRVVILPALNAPAVRASTRVSPIDQVNLNRAFPGDKDGTATEMIANFIEDAMMPVCDAVIDMHSGGKAASFVPCAMALPSENQELSEANRKLAEAFLTPLIWVMSATNDTRSVNYAADRNQKSVIAVELGGGGQVTPETLAIGERGVRNCLRHLGVLEGEVEKPKTSQIPIEISDSEHFHYAPGPGLFEPKFEPGDKVQMGDIAGVLYPFDNLEASPTIVKFAKDGIAFVRCHRGNVNQGELLATVGKIL